MEFVSSSPSKTARLQFSQNDLRAFQEETAHLLALRLEPALVEVARAGFMFSVKVSLNQRAFIF